MIGKAIRMKRIFKDDNKAVISALDFGAFVGTVKGIEKPRSIVKKIVDGGADALLMTPGFAKATHDLFAGKAGLIMR
ncbi:MAG TPA: fructose-bisphosphate aldolase, partial [Firmicutes bacterium]|nr:fructose-bisphosphate aldolase [Bacillota bacterium]